MTNAVIIPARYESTRFPGKPLAIIAGKPMIEWVVNSACKSKLANKVIVATDDKRIFDFVKEKFNTDACLTSKDHKSGTDRISEVVKKYPDIKNIVNLQGDEPLMPPEYIDKALNLLTLGSTMSSLVAPITTQEELSNPNIVKAVMDKDGYALYFSRSQIPYNRQCHCEESALGGRRGNLHSVREIASPLARNDVNQGLYFRHIGIYAYTRETLLQFSLFPPSPLEQIEQLEQLRMLENGIKIKLGVVPKAYPAVDSPSDIKIVENELKIKTKI